MTESTIQRNIIRKKEKEGYYVIKLVVTNKKGISDLLCLKKDEPPLFIEVKKSKGGVLAPLQKFRIEELRGLGFKAFATASVSEHYCVKDIRCHRQCKACKDEINELYGL
jgi:RecB family endonuclease NucS